MVGKAIDQVKEKTDVTIEAHELISPTELSIKEALHDAADMLQQGMYPSPGGSDEFIPRFHYIKELDRQE